MKRRIRRTLMAAMAMTALTLGIAGAAHASHTRESSRPQPNSHPVSIPELEEQFRRAQTSRPNESPGSLFAPPSNLYSVHTTPIPVPLCNLDDVIQTDAIAAQGIPGHTVYAITHTVSASAGLDHACITYEPYDNITGPAPSGRYGSYAYDQWSYGGPGIPGSERLVTPHATGMSWASREWAETDQASGRHDAASGSYILTVEWSFPKGKHLLFHYPFTVTDGQPTATAVPAPSPSPTPLLPMPL